MKKQLFLLISTLLLSGCHRGQPITYEDASRMFTEYFCTGTHKFVDSLLEEGEFRMVSSWKYYDLEKDKYVKGQYVSDYSKDKIYFHDIETTDDGYVREEWLFVFNNKTVNAWRRVSEDGEVKKYSEETDARYQMTAETLATRIYATGYVKLSANDFMSKVESKGKYYSNGEGNIQMSYKGTLHENSKYTSKINASYEFDKYLIKSAKYSYFGDGYFNNMGMEIPKKFSVKGKLETRKTAKVEYPDLSTFEKIVY